MACHLGYLVGKDEMYKGLKGKDFVFYRSRTDIEEDSTLDARAQRRVEKVLKDAGLIYVIERKHEPNKFIVRYSNIEKLDQKYQAERAEAKRLKEAHLAQQEERLLTAAGIDLLVTESSKADLIGEEDTFDTPHGTQTPVPPEQECTTRYNLEYNEEYKEINIRQANELHSEVQDQQHLSSASLSSSAPASSRSRSSVTALIKNYSHALKIAYRPQDTSIVKTRYADLLRVEKYFNPVAMNYIWKAFATEESRARCKEPWISGFIKWGFLDSLLENEKVVVSYCAQIADIELTAALKGRNADLVNEVLAPMGYHCDRSTGDITPPGSSSFPPAEQRRLKKSLINEHLLPRLDPEAQKELQVYLELV